MALNNRHLFLTVLEAGSQRSRCQQVGFHWGPSFGLQMAIFLSDPCMTESRELCGVPFLRALIPLMRAPLLWPNYLPKTPPPTTITLGIGISTYECLRDTDIQSMTTDIIFIEIGVCLCGILQSSFKTLHSCGYRRMCTICGINGLWKNDKTWNQKNSGLGSATC